MHHFYPAVRILLTTGTGDKVSIHQAHFISGKKTEIFLWRFLHEILPLDIQFSSKRDLTTAHFRNFLVVLDFEHLGLSLRVVVNHEFHRVQDRQHTGSLIF